MDESLPLPRGGFRRSGLQKPRRKSEHRAVWKLLQNRCLEEKSLLLGWLCMKEKKRHKAERTSLLTDAWAASVAGRFGPILCKEGDTGPRVHAPHSSPSRSAQASVHLLEYLLADHTLHSHLLKQKQMLVSGWSKVTLRAQCMQGQELGK